MQVGILTGESWRERVGEECNPGDVEGCGASSQAANKDCSISWEMAEEVIEEQRCSCRATPGSCRCDLPAVGPS